MFRSKTGMFVITILVGLVLVIAQAKKPNSEILPLAQATAQQQEEATPIQEGVMSDKQKKHSKIFKGFKEATHGKKLRDVVADKGDVEVIVPAGDVQAPRAANASQYLNTYLNRVSCKADAVLIGTVSSKASQLIEEGTFTFTDYEVSMEEILKNNYAAPIQANTNITVSRSGGAVKLNGHTIRAIDHRNEPLIVGNRYLLFLQLIPGTGAYRSLGNNLFEDSFQLSGGQIIQVSDKPLPFYSQRSSPEAPFLIELRARINRSCDN